MTHRDLRVALLCIDPLRHELGEFKPFNYSVRKVQAALVADPEVHADIRVFEYDSTEVAGFVEQLEAFDPDVVGASAYVWSFPTFFEVARALKRHRRDRLVVFGGPSARTELFALAPFVTGPEFIDGLVLGEGEEVMREIVRLADRTRSGLAGVKGLAVSTGSGWETTPPRELPVLETLASPFQLGLVAGVKTAHLETFRGCPLSCTFCQWGDLSKANRTFSVDYLVRELGSYVDMGIKSAMIVDAALNLNAKAFRNLRAAEREVGFFKQAFLHAEVYPQFITEEHLDFLRQVGGGVNLGLGLQSYNKNVLGNVERAFDEAKFEKVVADLLEITPRTELEIIMGLPGDNPDSFRRTLHRALGLGANVRVYHCLVLPNALMSRSPASFEMEFDLVNLSMISCLGWKDGAIQRMSRELTDLAASIPGAFLHNDGYGWHFPSDSESKRGAWAWHHMISDRAGAQAPDTHQAIVIDSNTAASPGRSEGSDSTTTAAPPRSLRDAEPSLFDELSRAVSNATGGAVTLDDAERERGGVILRLGLGNVDLVVDVRPEAGSQASYRVVGGAAFSYRRVVGPLPDGALRRLDDVISGIGPTARTLLQLPVAAAPPS